MSVLFRGAEFPLLPETGTHGHWAPRDRDKQTVGSQGQGHTDTSPVQAQGRCWCLSINVTTVLGPRWRSGPYFKLQREEMLSTLSPRLSRLPDRDS